jgi:DNA-binding Xre family transcriptional regulator
MDFCNNFAFIIKKTGNMIKLRIEEILRERGISKTQFAEMMGIAKQNVNLLLNTTNTTKMEKIAEVLGVKFTDLFVYDGEPQEELNGFVEYKGEVYRIKTKADLENLLLSIK